MNSEYIKAVVSNLRKPSNAKQRIHLSSRAVIFCLRLFEGKEIDEVEVQYILLQIAKYRNILENPENYISCPDIASYLYQFPSKYVSVSDIDSAIGYFDPNRDNEYNEIADLYCIRDSL